MQRRYFIAGLGLAAVGVGTATLYRKGFRYPPGIFEPEPAARHVKLDGMDIIAEREVFVRESEGGKILLRAFGPSPLVKVRADQAGDATITVGNIHPAARLLVTGDTDHVDETVEGLSRQVSFSSVASAETRLEWRFPNPGSYRFAALGDTGGNAELEWALNRAHELGADFFLHLGDLNYWEGDFQRSITYFDNAPLPCYVAIGNHDFHVGGPVYQPFITQIGPRNAMFDLGGIRFLNIDTASDTYPPWVGERGQLVRTLGGDPEIRDIVVFTHRPFSDPRLDFDHTINGIGETDWLHTNLIKAGVSNMITGHIHIKDEIEYEGIHTYIAGQGLGNDDVISNRPVSEILIGDVVPGEPVRYHWEALALPEMSLCHPRNLVIMRAQGKDELVKRLQSSCSFTE